VVAVADVLAHGRPSAISNGVDAGEDSDLVALPVAPADVAGEGHPSTPDSSARRLRMALTANHDLERTTDTNWPSAHSKVFTSSKEARSAPTCMSATMPAS